MRRSSRLMLALACLAVGMGGCDGGVQRTISISSEPAGALVYLNDEEVGRTPLVTPFTFYGVYDVRLERAGYSPLLTQQEAKAPWWEYPGPDLAAAAIPDAKSELAWHFEMQPRQPVDEPALIGRAREMQSMLREPVASDEASLPD